MKVKPALSKHKIPKLYIISSLILAMVILGIVVVRYSHASTYIYGTSERSVANDKLNGCGQIINKSDATGPYCQVYSGNPVSGVAWQRSKFPDIGNASVFCTKVGIGAGSKATFKVGFSSVYGFFAPTTNWASIATDSLAGTKSYTNTGSTVTLKKLCITPNSAFRNTMSNILSASVTSAAGWVVNENGSVSVQAIWFESPGTTIVMNNEGQI